jgi:hypothetical protein
LVSAPRADAALITLSAAEAQGNGWFFNSAQSENVVVAGCSAGHCSALFDGNVTGELGVAAFSLQTLLDYTPADTFSLQVTNTDLSTWNFDVIVCTGAACIANSGFPGTTGVFPATLGQTIDVAIPLASLLPDGNNFIIKGVSVVVSGLLPNTNNPFGLPDTSPDFRISPSATGNTNPPNSVPEPGVLSLVLASFGPLAVLARRRRK